jgi:hypothetical protein
VLVSVVPGPCPHACCRLLERANVVMRDTEDWEDEFLEFKEARTDATDKVLQLTGVHGPHPSSQFKSWPVLRSPRA